MTQRSVTMICAQYPPVYGGAGTQASLLARTLSDRSAKVSVVTLDQMSVGSALDGAVLVKRVGRHLDASRRIGRVASTVRLGVAASLHVLANRPRVVHIHGCYWWTIPPSIAARAIRARLVIKITRDGEDDVETVLSRRLGVFPIGWLSGLPIRLANLIVVLNEHASAGAISSGFGSKVRLLRNGVDATTFGRTPERRAKAVAGLHGRKVVTYVGYAVRHKGFFDLLEAWSRMPIGEAELWLVGPTAGFYRELDRSAPEAIRRLQATGHVVREFGLVPQEELAELLWGTDVFVLPSYVEGMPNSLFEAIVAGCRIVATQIPGIADALPEGSARLVSPGDIEGLTNEILAALEDDTPAHSQVLRLLRDRLAFDNVARAYEGLYGWTELSKEFS